MFCLHSSQALQAALPFSPVLSACCCFDAVLLACLLIGDKEWLGSDKAKLDCVGPGTCLRAKGAWLWGYFWGCCRVPSFVDLSVFLALAHSLLHVFVCVCFPSVLFISL